MQAFENRLKKRYKHLKKWAKREQINCFRVYNWDIPEYPFTVDKYNDHAVIYIFDRNQELDREGKKLLVLIVSEVLGIENEKIFVKYRKKQKGKSQYNQIINLAYEITVEENGIKLLLNLSGYLDTGLFLDHRISRKIIMEKSAGKSVLNLFAYTGSFSVAAAKGGAKFVKTVDMSNTYLDWTRRNIKLNRQDEKIHDVYREDVLGWLEANHKQKFDLIILDPPSFSNSKKMEKSFDIQRDHSELLINTAMMLNRKGNIFFSTNKRKFKLDESLSQRFKIEELTSKTIPEDFKNKAPHSTFWISLKS